MNRTICILAAALSISPLFAQQAKLVSNKTINSVISRETLLKNPDVLWLGETYSIFLLDELDTDKTENKKHLEEMGIKNNNRVHVVPIKNLDLRKSYTWYPSDYTLLNNFIDKDGIAKGEFYADAECTQKLSGADIQKKMNFIDTLMIYDPVSQKELKQVVVNVIMHEDIKCYQAKHLVYYNQKTNSFGTLMEAVAPMLYNYDKDGNFIDRKPLFWVKIDNKNTAQDLQNPSMNWARRTSRTFNFDEIKTLKGTKTPEECMSLFVQKISKNAKTEDVRNTMGFFEKMSEKDIANLGSSIDTIITFDPTTFKETVQTVKFTFEGKDVKRFRFMQEWYWDYKQHKLSLHTQFFAPIIQRYDDTGKFLNEGPLFWKPVK